MGSTHISILLLLFLLRLWNRLLNLLLFHVVALFHVQDTMQVEPRLKLADHEVVLPVRLNALDGKAADPGVHPAWKKIRL